MLDHVSITVVDLARAGAFYDAALGALGIARVGASAGWIGYGARADAADPDAVYLSLRPGPAGHAPGRHWAFKARSRAMVDAFWRQGLAGGGRDSGAPGLRPDYHASYYAAFLRDPDGNQVEAVCHRAVPADA